MNEIDRKKRDRISKKVIKGLLILFSLSGIIVVLLNIMSQITMRNEAIIAERKLDFFRQMNLEEDKKEILKLCKKDPIYQKRYDMLMNEEKRFPIPYQYLSGISYTDSWGGARTFGGERVHEGCDIMSKTNVRGEIPVVSMTDGVVENLGWLKLGGYRIGIRSETGAYYYYAHLDHYVDGIEIGDTVKAGELIGFMGDTGYSEVEGTTGNFDVHLHLGIYLHDEGGEDFSINPYWLIKSIEKEENKEKV